MTEKHTSGTLYLDFFFFQMTPMVAGLHPHICTESPVQKATGTQKVVQDRAFLCDKLGCRIRAETHLWHHLYLWSKQAGIPISQVENYQLQGGNGPSKSKEITVVLISVHSSRLRFS